MVKIGGGERARGRFAVNKTPPPLKPGFWIGLLCSTPIQHNNESFTFIRLHENVDMHGLVLVQHQNLAIQGPRSAPIKQ